MQGGYSGHPEHYAMVYLPIWGRPSLGVTSAMPICWQGGGAGDGDGGAVCGSVTVLPVVEVPRLSQQ